MEKGKLYSIKIKGWKEKVSGILIDVGKDLILINSIFQDYMIDGYKIINKNYIESIERNDEEIFVEKVLAANNKINLINIDIPLDISIILGYLNDKQLTFGIMEKKETYFRIGKISKIMKASFYLIPLSKKGQWMEKSLLYRFTSIRIITLNTDYVNSLMAFNNRIYGER